MLAIIIKKRLLILFLLWPAAVFAQTNSLEHPARIAIGVSANAYKGDLGNAYSRWTSAAHISLLLKHQRRLHGGLHAAIGSITGQAVPDNTFAQNKTVYNHFFSTRFVTIHYGLQYNLVHRKNLVVYISQGLGFMRFMPEDEQGISLQEQYATREASESYGNVAAVLPTQLGMDYYFANRFGVGLKAGWLNTATDYLDNISLLGNRTGNDNVLQYQFLFYIPAKF